MPSSFPIAGDHLDYAIAFSTNNADIIDLQVPEAANWVGWSARALPMWWQVFLRTESGKPVKGLTSLNEVKEAMKAGVNSESE